VSVESSDRITELINTVAAALDELELLDVDVQMPAEINGGGVRADAGVILFERYEDGEKLATITWDGEQHWTATHN
jgi:hypothetical protein